MKNQTLVLTGAFGTLGRAVAAHAASLGARVACIDVADEPRGFPQAPDGGEFAFLGGRDLQQDGVADAAVAEIVARFGRIDALANVAGGFRWEAVEGGDTATWDALYGQNVRTALNMSRAAIGAMKPQGSGAIVNVGANGGLRAGMGMGAYAASKSGVHRLTEAFAEEFKSAGIRVNAVLPSIIDTPPNRADMPNEDFSKWVSPEALAKVIVFLLSDDAQPITGALIPVTGRV